MTTATTSDTTNNGERCFHCGAPRFDINENGRPTIHPDCYQQPPEAATPRPWVVDDDSGIYYVVAPEVALVATLDPSDDDAPAQANAELIVRAVNAFDLLVSALKQAKFELSTEGLPQKKQALAVIDEALKLARGE